ncbi:MAG: hypothetical protein CMJ65_11680 [Planctomycetaceae bacterium]|jgi:hypothetical protein|nr:hypothetical protein [Planctomycetaceae bacterium]
MTTPGDTILADKAFVEFHADSRNPHSGCLVVEEHVLDEGHLFATDSPCVTIAITRYRFGSGFDPAREYRLDVSKTSHPRNPIDLHTMIRQQAMDRRP